MPTIALQCQESAAYNSNCPSKHTHHLSNVYLVENNAMTPGYCNIN